MTSKRFKSGLAVLMMGSLLLPQSVFAAPETQVDNPSQTYQIDRAPTLYQTAYLSSFQNISEAERHKQGLFQAKKDPFGAMGLNFIPFSFGAGSYLQGDLWGGVTLSVIDGIGALGLTGTLLELANTKGGTLASFIPLFIMVSTQLLGRTTALILPWIHYNMAMSRYYSEPDPQTPQISMPHAQKNVMLFSYHTPF